MKYLEILYNSIIEKLKNNNLEFFENLGGKAYKMNISIPYEGEHINGIYSYLYRDKYSIIMTTQPELISLIDGDPKTNLVYSVPILYHSFRFHMEMSILKNPKDFHDSIFNHLKKYCDNVIYNSRKLKFATGIVDNNRLNDFVFALIPAHLNSLANPYAFIQDSLTTNVDVFLVENPVVFNPMNMFDHSTTYNKYPNYSIVFSIFTDYYFRAYRNSK